MRRLSGLLAAAAVLLAACGGTTTAPAPAEGTAAAPAPAAKPLTQITFSLDGPFVGWYAPFFVSQSKGYYKQAGLDVQFVEGKGSVTTAQLVGNGNYPLAFCDASAAATAITKGVPIKVVAVIFQKSPLAVIYPADHPLKDPADLVGKSIAASPGSTSAEMFPALLTANHIDPSKVKVVGASSLAASVAAIAEGKVDGIVNFSDYAIPLMEAKGVKLGSMSFADHGLPLLSESIVVNNDYLKQHPDVVKSFVQASLQGWKYAQANPDDTVKIQQDALGKDVPGASGELKLSFPLMQSADTQGHPLGWSSDHAWQQTLDTLQQYEKLGQPKPLSEYYTNAFIGG